jgi:exodeoxyribonuclease VII large subunit
MARDEVVVQLAGAMQAMFTAMRYRLLEARNQLKEAISSRALNAVPERIRTFRQRFDDAVHDMESVLKRRINAERAAQQNLKLRIRDANIRHKLARQRGELDVLTARLNSSRSNVIDKNRERFSVLAGKLQSLSPLAVLARGYAIAFDSASKIIKRPDEIRSGERLRVRVEEGDILCTKD